MNLFTITAHTNLVQVTYTCVAEDVDEATKKLWGELFGAFSTLRRATDTGGPMDAWEYKNWSNARHLMAAFGYMGKSEIKDLFQTNTGTSIVTVG